MGSGDLGVILIAVLVIGGGFFLLQSGALQLGAPDGEQEPEQDATTDIEEQGQATDEPVEQDIAFPIPVYIPIPGLSRREVCRRQPPFGFGGSCNSECRQHGMNSSICRTCISYCGAPVFGEAPRPRTKLIPTGKNRRTNFPRSGRECPRGQRYNWQSKKCEKIIQQTTPKPKPKPKPTAPAESAFARGGYW